MGKYPLIFAAVTKLIKKADDKLENLLADEGYIEPRKTVEEINIVNDELTEILENEKKLIISAIDAEDVKSANDLLPTLLKLDIADKLIAAVFSNHLKSFVQTIASSCMAEIDSDLPLSTISNRTTDWIDEWSPELGKIMKLSSHEKLQSILKYALENGESIQTVTQKLMDAYEFSPQRARRVALTEMLTAHSVASQEAYMQSPAVSEKMWMHTGNHKNEPRLNHQAMHGKRVKKNEPYELIGADGNIYYPMCPKATNLPPAERINCHCISQPVVGADVLGLSLEERKRLQQQAIDEDNGQWEKELNAKNKAKAGINEDTVKIDWLKAKDKEAQIRYFGGVKSKWALVESGVISTDAQLEGMFKTETYVKDGKTLTRKTQKSLQELRADGIITVSNEALKHATVGDFTGLGNPKRPPSFKNGGRPSGGGHGQSNIQELEARGIPYNIEKTFENGVRVGNIPLHKDDGKQQGTLQSWFPEDWSDDDILVAGTYTANKPALVEDIINKEGITTGRTKYQKYNGITVTVIEVVQNGETYIGTIYPDNIQRKVD